MPNPIKYSTGSETNALKKGNFYIGTGSEGKGPSDVTGYYNGVTPQTGGYVIYMFKDGAPGNLSYHSAANDSELISFTSGLAGQTYTGVSQCFDYYAGQTDKVMIIQEFPSDYPLNYPNIVMPGLILNLDAGITQSYSGSGTTWTDINGLGQNNNGTLINGPTFNSDNGGSIVFDGVDDYVDCGNDSSLNITTGVTLGCVFSGGTTGPFDRETAIQKGFFTQNPGMYGLQFVNNKARFALWNSGGDNRFFDSSAQIINSIKYVICTWDGFTMKIYINGVLDSSQSYSTTLSTNTQNLGVGKSITENGNYFGGNIYTSQVYNRALSAAEVLQNYNSLKGRFGL
jgi:hypothetical protein